MTSFFRSLTFIGTTCAALHGVSLCASDDLDWPVYGGDYAGTKHSPLKQIHLQNVDSLEVAWMYRTDDMSERPPTTIECNPLVIEDVIYLTTPGLKLAALKADSGKEIWVYDPWAGERGGGVNRGVAFWTDDAGDRRLFMSAGPYLHCVNADTGERVKEFGGDGKLDLREDLDRDAFYLSVFSSSPCVVWKDLLIMGSSVGEGPNLSAPGHIRAYDVRTGKREWIFHTIPYPGEAGYETWPEEAWKTVGGANAWAGFTLDAERGWVFCGTGSAAYDHYGGNRSGKNLYANCILALDAATGRRIWHYQVVHHDLWDYDVGCPPNLVTLRRGGKTVDAVAQPTKMGHLFILDRKTGEPLFPVQERPVPASQMPGEESWPTQPIPLKPPPYAQQRFTAEEATDLNPAARRYVMDRLKEMQTGDIFIPPGFQPSVALPQFNGGTDWGGGAFDPDSGILYVNTSNEAEWISMVDAKPKEETTLGELGLHLYHVICSNCHSGQQRAGAGGLQSPSLQSVPERLSRDAVREVLLNGRGQMPSFATLSDTETDALLAFLFREKEDKKVKAKQVVSAWMEEIPYVATGHREFRDPEGFPVNQRPWGTLSAIDLNEGEILWQVPLGTYPELEKRGLSPTGTFNMGGPLVTAGGLVFIGGAMDERFRAYNKATGEQVWEFQMEAGGYATPCTYSVNGKQYVVIAAGGGGKPGTKPGDAYYAFALP